MAFRWGSVICGNVVSGDGNPRICRDRLRDLLVGVPLFPQGFYFIAYHPDKGFYGEHFRSEACKLPKRLLCANGFFYRIGLAILVAHEDSICYSR